MDSSRRPIVERGTFFNIFLDDESLKLTVVCRPHQLFYSDNHMNGNRMYSFYFSDT